MQTKPILVIVAVFVVALVLWWALSGESVNPGPEPDPRVWERQHMEDVKRGKSK